MHNQLKFFFFRIYPETFVAQGSVSLKKYFFSALLETVAEILTLTRIFDPKFYASGKKLLSQKISLKKHFGNL